MLNMQTLSILITDDITENRAYIAQVIQSVLNNVQIQEAEDGETAVKMTEEKIAATGRSFDVIIMDYKMPGLNGQQTTASIRQIENRAQAMQPSIIITWSSALNKPYQGADDWLPKILGQQDIERVFSTFGLM